MADALTPSERSLRASVASHTSWSQTEDRTARTAKGRAKFDERFLDEVDPSRVLPEAQRQRRAESARKAYFARLALKSAQSRRAKAGR